MHRIARVVIGLLLWTTSGRAADGIWILRERFCVVADGARSCGRGQEEFMFRDGIAYFRTGPEAYWTEVGVVGTAGKSVRVQVSREGIGRLVEDRIGIDVSDLLEQFSHVYKGRVVGSQIVNGTVRVAFRFDYDGTSHVVRGGGTFRGRRTGDAYPVPPPDPYFGELAPVPYGRATDEGALRVLKAALRGLVDGAGAQ